jgi:hypothetical protein
MDASPTTFSSRCTELRSRIERIQSSDADKHLVRTMETIRTELREHLSRIALLAKTMEVFAGVENMPRPGIDAVAVKNLRSKISTLIGKLDKNRSRITENSGWAECSVRAKALADTLEKDLRKIWADYITSEQPGYEMFQSFRGLPQCGPPLRELDRLSGILKGIRSNIPQDPSPIPKVRETITLMRKQIASLGLDGEPPEMVAFLKRCSAEGGAPLTDLTPQIFRWIQEKGFAADLRVKPR